MKYDLDELKATTSIGGKIIDALKDAMSILENPQDHMHEQVSESWIFITGLKNSCDHNKKLVCFGANHGRTSMLEGFEQRDTGPTPQWINPIFEGRPSGLSEALDSLLALIKKEEKSKESE